MIGKRFRVAAAAAVFVVATSACQVDVNLTAKVSRSGGGDFKLQFIVDKELVDLARNAGQDPFADLGAIPEQLNAQGWRIDRSNVGGGLVVTVERPFSSTDDLNRALEALEQASTTQEGPTAQFFRMRVSRSSSFLRTHTDVRGSIDLTSSGLLGAAELPDETLQQLSSIIEQAANEFFKFNLRVELPGSVSSTSGDPDRVDGGVAEWSPQLGKTLEFRASSSAYNTLGLTAIGVPILLLLAVAVLWLIRRRRPAPIEPPTPDPAALVPDPAAERGPFPPPRP